MRNPFVPFIVAQRQWRLQALEEQNRGTVCRCLAYLPYGVLCANISMQGVEVNALPAGAETVYGSGSGLFSISFRRLAVPDVWNTRRELTFRRLNEGATFQRRSKDLVNDNGAIPIHIVSRFETEIGLPEGVKLADRPVRPATCSTIPTHPREASDPPEPSVKDALDDDGVEAGSRKRRR
uniref:PilZ domain-containing protein n=1 Tax=Trichuris muris TaxID=70415 RepID=A0A5S6QP00_TRIMR